MTDVHLAAHSYEHVSEEYERGRPAYPAAAVAHVVAELRLRPHAKVLDVGAGTGKLTRELADAGLAPIALDPSPTMLEQVRRTLPRTETVVGAAERIPLPDASVELVAAGQAFHWFRAPEALAEMHRVLTPRGGVALIWNRRDEADPVQALLAELTDPPGRATPRGWKLDVPAIVGATGLFADVSSATFAHMQTTDRAGVISRLHSSSFVAALPVTRRRALEERLRSRLALVDEPIELRYTTIVYLTRRR